MKFRHFEWVTPEGEPIVRGPYAQMLTKGLLSMAYELHDAIEFNERYDIGLEVFDVLSNAQKVWLYYKLTHGFFDFRSEFCAHSIFIDAVITGAFHELNENVAVEISESMNNPATEQSLEWRSTVLDILKLLKLNSNVNIKDDEVPPNCDCEDLSLWQNALLILRQRILHDVRFDVEKYLKQEIQKETILQVISSIDEPYYTAKPEIKADFNVKKALKTSTHLCEKRIREINNDRKKFAERWHKAVALANENQCQPVIGPQKMPWSTWQKFIPVAFCIDDVVEKEMIPSCQWVDLALSVFRFLHARDPSILETVQRDASLGRFLTMAPETRYEPQRIADNVFIERYKFTILRDRMLRDWFSFYGIPFSSFKVWLKPVVPQIAPPTTVPKGRRKLAMFPASDVTSECCSGQNSPPTG